MAKNVQIGWLQQIAMDYARYLMSQYTNPICALKIENWRTRLTGKHDTHNFLNNSPFALDYRQAKQIVDYAKQYILPLINSYYVNNP